MFDIFPQIYALFCRILSWQAFTHFSKSRSKKFATYMFKTREGGEGSKAVWTMFKKTALLARDGFPNTFPCIFLGILCISNLPQLKWISHEVIWKKLENIFVVWKLSQQQTDTVAGEVFILSEENLSYSGKTRPNYLLFSHNDQQRIVGSKVASGFVLLCFCKFCVFFLPESWQEHLIGREDSCASVDNICEN